MIVERHVTLDSLYAVVRRGPCPYCRRDDEHAHKIGEVVLGNVSDEVATTPIDLDQIDAQPWNVA